MTEEEIEEIASSVNTFVQDVFYGFVKKDPRVDHLDTDSSGFDFWDSFHLPHTPYRMYFELSVSDIDEDENMNLWFTVRADSDPDLREFHPDFKGLDDKIYDFKFQLKDLYVDDEIDDFTGNLVSECEKGFDVTMRTLQVHCQDLLSKIDKEIENGKNIKKEHEWLYFDWVNIEEVLDFAGFGIEDIPKLILEMGLIDNPKYVNQELRDLFLF
jgi:hypothetical protein